MAIFILENSADPDEMTSYVAFYYKFRKFCKGFIFAKLRSCGVSR